MVRESISKRQAAQKRGYWGERLCRLALTLKGWRILAHGYTSKKGTGAGEIDLIAKRGRTIAFIEVKTRPNLEDALLAVSREQQQRITRGAERYMSANPDLADFNIRFDVMIVRPWKWPMHLSDAWQA